MALMQNLHWPPGMEEMPQDCLEQSRPPHPCGLATHGTVTETRKMLSFIVFAHQFSSPAREEKSHRILICTENTLAFLRALRVFVAKYLKLIFGKSPKNVQTLLAALRYRSGCLDRHGSRGVLKSRVAALPPRLRR